MILCPHCCATLGNETQKEHEEHCTALWISRHYAYLKTLPDAEHETRRFDDWCDENCG